MRELCVLLVFLVSRSMARLSITTATPSGSIFRSGENMRLECSRSRWVLHTEQSKKSRQIAVEEPRPASCSNVKVFDE